jgi:hypothetical protein
LIDPAPANHAVLSQDPGQHRQNLLTSDWALLDQAHHYPQMLEDWFGARERVSGRWRSDRTLRNLLSPPRILEGLFDFAWAVPVIGDTALDGTTLAMRFFAAKGTAQILAPGIARVREKENPAMPASGQARSQLRLAFQD